MNKIIKVIDLYNKIANGEEVPKRVKYNGITYNYRPLNKQGLKYADAEGSAFYNYLIGVVNNLNQEVEIIEESDEIDIQGIEELNHYTVISAIEGKTEENIDDELSKIKLTINKLVQAVKHLDKTKEDK